MSTSMKQAEQEADRAQLEAMLWKLVAIYRASLPGIAGICVALLLSAGKAGPPPNVFVLGMQWIFGFLLVVTFATTRLGAMRQTKGLWQACVALQLPILLIGRFLLSDEAWWPYFGLAIANCFLAESLPILLNLGVFLLWDEVKSLGPTGGMGGGKKTEEKAKVGLGSFFGIAFSFVVWVGGPMWLLWSLYYPLLTQSGLYADYGLIDWLLPLLSILVSAVTVTKLVHDHVRHPDEETDEAFLRNDVPYINWGIFLWISFFFVAAW